MPPGYRVIYVIFYIDDVMLKIWLHYGSTESYLSALVMDKVITRDIQSRCPLVYVLLLTITTPANFFRDGPFRQEKY